MLADAVCWGLVEVVRSDPPARGGSLGFFSVYVAFVLMPAMPWAESADLLLVFLPVPTHASPWWQAIAAPSDARAAARLAGWTPCDAGRPCPDARAFAKDCTAVTSTMSACTVMALTGPTVDTWRRLSTAAAAARFGRLHPMLLDAAPRLSARGATGVDWRPASAKASSQTGKESECRKERMRRMEAAIASRAMSQEDGDAVGVAEVMLGTSCATTSTAPPRPTSQGSCGGAVGVTDIRLATGFALTSTAAGATAAMRRRGTPCVADSLVPARFQLATHDVPADGGRMRAGEVRELGRGRTG